MKQVRNFKNRILLMLLLCFSFVVMSSMDVFANSKEATDMSWSDSYDFGSGTVVKYNAVRVDLNSDRYEIGVSTGYDKTEESEPFIKQIERNKATIASNGNFFSSYTPQGTREYYGTVVKNGNYDHKGSLGSIGFDHENKAVFFEFIERQLPEWLQENKIMWAVSGDPIIVKDGLNVTGEFKTTRNDLDSPAARTAMGYTKENVLLIITSRKATIRQMGDILIKLGAVYGVNLDGGASSALYYRGKTLTPAGRDLNVVFYIRDLDQPQPPSSAIKSDAKFTLFGEEVQLASYNIDGNNYVQLRDLANILKDSNAKFDLSWNAADNSILLEKGREYTQIQEIKKPVLLDKADAYRSRSVVTLDGKKLKLKGFNIGGNNYYKLRDLSPYLDIKIIWYEYSKTIKISAI